MNVTEVRITTHNDEKLKAFATVTFDDCFVVRGLRVIFGSNGYFVAMPSRKLQDGTHKDIVHPTNIETRQAIEDAVLEAYAVKMDIEPIHLIRRPPHAADALPESGVAWPIRRTQSG
jgi:stage V sporulation protein G